MSLPNININPSVAAEKVRIAYHRGCSLIPLHRPGNADLSAVTQIKSVPQAWQRRWTIVSLCFVAFMLCNMDRVNMSIAVMPMSTQFGWDKSTVGLVQSSFFWCVLQHLSCMACLFVPTRLIILSTNGPAGRCLCCTTRCSNNLLLPRQHAASELQVFEQSLHCAATVAITACMRPAKACNRSPTNLGPAAWACSGILNPLRLLLVKLMTHHILLSKLEVFVVPTTHVCLRRHCPKRGAYTPARTSHCCSTNLQLTAPH